MQEASLLPSKPPIVDRRRKEYGEERPKAIVLLCGATAGLIYPVARSCADDLYITL